MEDKMIYMANMQLLDNFKNYKYCILESDINMATFYEQSFEAQWNILYLMNLKNNNFNFKWFVSFFDNHFTS